MSPIRILVLAICLAAAACGGSSSDDGAATTTTTSDLASTTTPATSTSQDATSTSSSSAPSTTTSVAPTVSADAGTAADPVALGSYARAGDWLVKVVDVDPTGLRLIEDEDGFLGDPDQGNAYYAIDVEAVYVGNRSESIWFSFFYNARTVDGREYDEFEHGCGFIDNALSDTGEAFPGGVVRGVVCFEVDEADTGQLALVLEPLGSFDPEDMIFFGLQDGVGSPTGLTDDVAFAEPDTSLGSRANPVALGSLARVDDWFLEVLSVDPDATDAVLAANDFNEPPSAGESYLQVVLRATYTGQGSQSFFGGLSWSWLGESNVARTSFDHSCGWIDDDLGMAGHLFTNAQIEGSICVAVPADEASDGLLVVDANGEDRTFMALMPGVGEPGVGEVVPGEVRLGSDPGERGNPYAFGESARVGDWDVAVNAVDDNAEARLQEESAFTPPAPEGSVYLLIELSLTNTDDEPAGVWESLTWKALIDDIAVDGFNAGCGSVPDDLSFADAVAPAETLVGNVCFVVPADRVGDVVLILDEGFGFEQRSEFFALR